MTATVDYGKHGVASCLGEGRSAACAAVEVPASRAAQGRPPSVRAVILSLSRLQLIVVSIISIISLVFIVIILTLLSSLEKAGGSQQQTKATTNNYYHHQYIYE